MYGSSVDFAKSSRTEKVVSVRVVLKVNWQYYIVENISIVLRIRFLFLAEFVSKEHGNTIQKCVIISLADSRWPVLSLRAILIAEPWVV